MSICASEKCTGCGACVKICPTQCIKMSTDLYGFRYPVVDENVCIHCGLCTKTCPSLNKLPVNIPKAAFAFQATKDSRKVQRESASGGAFYVLAKKVLDKGGIVFGCAWGESFRVEHIAITNIKELYRLQKSKYIQSNPKNTYEETKKYLENGKTVLYSGTPCQIAGLRSFLEIEYSNLLTADVICHGVPSQELFDDYLRSCIYKKGCGLVKYEFRTTDPRHPKYDGRIWRSDEFGVHSRPLIWQNDSYFSAFMYGLTYRDSCYKCLYANRNRVSDVTFGDFWGIEKIDKQCDDSYGVSLVLLNTDKGKKWFKNNGDNYYKVVDIGTACKNNEQLNRSSVKTSQREKFLHMWKKKGYKAVDREFKRKEWKRRWKSVAVYYCPHIIKVIVRKIRSR